MDVSIIIVSYNTKELTRNCLSSVFEKTAGLDFEVIVSDNGSLDGSVQMIKKEFPQVILVENNANLGFGAANNRGLDRACGKYIFYLNSDTILLNNAVKFFFDYWEASKDNIGALGANLQNFAGEIIHSFGYFPNMSTSLKDLIRLTYGIYKLTFLYLFSKPLILKNENKSCIKKYIGPVEYITGADLFLLNAPSARFDENFFMYCEETDLQYTLFKEGKKMLVIDGPEIIHLEGGSGKKSVHPIRYLATFSSLNFMTSRIYFFKKHGASRNKVRLMKLLTLLVWLNPLVYKKAKAYIAKMLSI